jgi:hypothetical protein
MTTKFSSTNTSYQDLPSSLNENLKQYEKHFRSSLTNLTSPKTTFTNITNYNDGTTPSTLAVDTSNHNKSYDINLIQENSCRSFQKEPSKNFFESENQLSNNILISNNDFEFKSNLSLNNNSNNNNNIFNSVFISNLNRNNLELTKFKVNSLNQYGSELTNNNKSDDNNEQYNTKFYSDSWPTKKTTHFSCSYEFDQQLRLPGLKNKISLNPKNSQNIQPDSDVNIRSKK